MAIEILADLEEIAPRSPEWHELRKLGWGGSDAGKLCGFGGTPYEAWSEKVRPVSLEEEDEPEYMRWGRLLEPVVRDEFADRTGIEVHPFPRMVRNPDYPFMLANVDGLTGPVNALTGVYEGKTTRIAEAWGENEDGSTKVPPRYVIQGMHYLAVLGLEVIHFACLVGGQQLRIAEVERNENLIADLIEIEESFWRKVIEGEPPQVSAADVANLRKRWTPAAGKVIELPESFRPKMVRRAELKAQVKVLEEEIDGIDAEVMAAMGDAEEAKIGSQVVATWKGTAGRLKSKELREAHPEIAAQFTGAPSRRFTPKEITE